MKFKRINYLKPIRTYRGHFIDITLEYEMDLEGSSGVTVQGFSNWTDKGFFEYETQETTNLFRIRIRGRFEQVFSEQLNIALLLPTTGAMYTDANVVDRVDVTSLLDTFWTGNPIRIPLRNRPTNPVGLWVEEQFGSGNFRKVASLKVADITDQYGYFVEVDQILQPYLERFAQKDFPAFIELENDEFGVYRQSARRFHLGGHESLMSGGSLPNIFTAIAGKQDPEKAFRSGNFWGKSEPFLSWRADGFAQKMASGYSQKLPLSLLVDQVEFELTKEDTEDGNSTQTIFQNQGEQIVDMVMSEKYVFALSNQADGTRVLVAEAEGCYFRAIAFVPNIEASRLLVREIEDEVPMLMIVSEEGETVVVRGFRAPIFEEMEIAFVHRVLKPYETSTWVLVGATANLNAGCTLAFNLEETAYNALVVVPETNGQRLINIFIDYLPNPINAIRAIEVDKFLISVFGEGTWIFSSNFTVYSNPIGSSSNAQKCDFYVKSLDKVYILFYGDSGYSIYLLDTTTETITDTYTPGTVPDTDPNKRYIGGRGDFLFCTHGGSIANLFNISAGTFDLAFQPDFGQSPIVPFLINRFGDVIDFRVGALIAEAGKWRCRVPSLDIHQPPIAGYVVQNLVADEAAQTFAYKSGTNTEVVYKSDGSYLRQVRQLYFRNQAGAYEFLLLPGDGGISHTSKKVMSSRYVDAASALADGEEMIAWVNDSSRTLSTNTGFISKKEYDYFLQELLLTKEAYLVENGDWCPVKLNLAKAEPVMDRPNLYQIDLNLEKSWSR